MKPADEIRRLIHESQIATGPGADERMLRGALDELEERRRRATTHPEPALWRIIMTSRTTKIAAAAGIMIAALIAFHFLGNPVGSTLTFAQVIQPILRAGTAEFDIIIGPEDDNAPVIHDMVMGSRIRRTVAGMGNTVAIIDLESSRILTLSEEKKEAQYLSLEGLPSIPNYMDHLKNVLLMLDKSPDFFVEDLGVQEIDGREVVGFFAKHPRTEITLWADAETGLPVRIEQNEGQMRTVCKNMQFDVPFDESLFSMDVPEGYVSAGETTLDLLGATEEDFIEGLRIRAEIFGDGYFPDGVAIEDFMRSIEAMQGKGEELGLSKEEEAELGIKMNKHLLFIRFFRQKAEGEWTYRGQGVKLGEAQTPIFWYRPKGSEAYRVIYGDLHVEEAAEENLPEPLDADDVPAPKPTYQQWDRPEFVGRQIDYWMILPEGKARVKAYLTLLKGPQDTALLPVRLPYAEAPLEGVLLGRVADAPVTDTVSLPFHKTGDGTYDIELPIDKLTAGRNTIILQWHVSLDDLKFEQGYYMTKLQSLVPVVSYELKAGADPNSGFEPMGETQGLWAPAFSQGRVDSPKTEFGACGLPIRKRR